MSYSNIEEGYDFLYRAYEILKNNNKEFDGDLLLIESIENTADAQMISQVIDMKKYGDMYNEKVQGFY